MNLHPSLVFLGGLVVILFGAELVLRGAVRLAAMLGVQPIVVGMTVVALGTSAPELAIGITAVLEDRGELAVGNIAGTNIFNILFILGLTSAIRALPLTRSSIRLDVPVMIASALTLLWMCRDRVLSRGEGLVLVGAAVAYTVALFHSSRRETGPVRREFAQEYGPQALQVAQGGLPGVWYSALTLAGMGLTVLGAHWIVDSATSLARMFGVTDAIIGLTVVAVGTSAPELATTVVATIKNERDVAVGNLIGSSVYNVLVILGATAIAAPHGVDVSSDVLWIDLPLGAAVAIVCYPVFRSDRMVSRREGMAFLLAYFAYMTALLILRT